MKEGWPLSKVAFIGKMFSGKTTAAQYLVNEYGYDRLAFANPVKELTAEILTLIEKTIGQNAGKIYSFKEVDEAKLEKMRQEFIESYRNPDRQLIFINDPNVTITNTFKHWSFEEVEINKGNPTIRKLLQLVGTELGRELIGYTDVWVDILRQRVQGLENCVVDDCRFPNEAEALREEGFQIIRLVRPEKERLMLLKAKYPKNWEEILNHSSETSLDNFEADVILRADNVMDLENLVAVVHLTDS